MQDSTIAPLTGGISGNGIFAYDRGTFLRNNIWGFNIPIIIQGQYLIQDNYLHDIWFKAGDHTDVINVNPNGSNGVIKHNYIDGIRSDGDFTHNGIGIGIYNDAKPGSGTAISKNWTIDNNHITRSNHLIFAAATPPFIIKNNVLTTKSRYAPRLQRPPRRHRRRRQRRRERQTGQNPGLITAGCPGSPPGQPA